MNNNKKNCACAPFYIFDEEKTCHSETFCHPELGSGSPQSETNAIAERASLVRNDVNNNEMQVQHDRINTLALQERVGERGQQKKAAFTLAEMMVVMLILTIVLAAFAPMMTKRKIGGEVASSGDSGPWKYASNNSDIYYGLDTTNTAMIGQNEKASGDDETRLILNTSGDGQSHLLLKRGDNIVGKLIANTNNFLFGSNFISTMTGVGDTAYGIGALTNLGDGSYNTAFGYNALNSENDGHKNTAIGYNALATSDDGRDNVAVGYNTLSANSTGYSNTAVGSGALAANTTAAGNTAVGYNALTCNTTASNNVAIGPNTLSANTTGIDNVAIGYNTLSANTNGAYNTAVGSNALAVNSSRENTALGYSALAVNTTGAYNTAVGTSALSSNTTSRFNTAIGYETLHSNTTGNFNTAVGKNALGGNTTGYFNTAVGYSALESNTTGNSNTAIGSNALNLNSTGTNNTAFGNSALQSNKTGKYNVAIGESALGSVLGNANTAIGTNACYYITGSNKTCLGYNSGPTATDSSTTGVVYLGNSSTTSIVSGVNAISVYSDKRLKDIKSKYTTGLEALRELVPYNFVYKADKDKTLRVGMIAQDVQKVVPDAVIKNGDGYLILSQGNIFYVMLNAVKQLDKLVQGVIEELKVVELKLDTLIKQENAKDKKIKDLEKRIERLEKNFN